MSLTYYDFVIFDAWIGLIDSFNVSRFIDTLRPHLEKGVELLRAWTGKTISLTSIEAVSFQRYYTSISSWRQEQNVPSSDVPDWLITCGASTCAIRPQQSSVNSANGILNININDPYIPGVRLGRISFLPLTGDQVYERGSFDIEIETPGQQKQTRSLSAPSLATIRLKDLIYDVFGNKQRGVQWVGGILEWSKLPTLELNKLFNFTNAEVLGGLFTPIHFQLPISTSVDINVESPIDQNAQLLIVDPNDFTKIITSIPLNLRAGLNTIRIRGKRTLFGYSTLQPYQITITDLKSIVRVEATAKRIRFWW